MILVTGRVFDVLDVPAVAGRACRPMAAADVGPARSRSGHGADVLLWRPGARLRTSTSGGRAVSTASPEEVADVAGLRWHCRDSYVLAPPSRSATGPQARWLRDPAAYELPDGVRLLEVLADASSRPDRSDPARPR